MLFVCLHSKEDGIPLLEPDAFTWLSLVIPILLGKQLSNYNRVSQIGNNVSLLEILIVNKQILIPAWLSFLSQGGSIHTVQW